MPYNQRHDNVGSLAGSCRRNPRSRDTGIQSIKSFNQLVFQISLSYSKIFVLELTICHETNLVNSKNYKIHRYNSIQNLLQCAYIKILMYCILLPISLYIYILIYIYIIYINIYIFIFNYKYNIYIYIYLIYILYIYFIYLCQNIISEDRG